MRVIVAITGASGAIYARKTLELLLASAEVSRIALLRSRYADDVMQAEGVTLPTDERIEEYANDDMWASPASGSARWDAMIVVPASMGTVGRVASGVSSTLIERAADVMLKERRRLIFVVRESPYSLIHLRNMTTLTEAGAIIAPASPGFYLRPDSIEALCLHVAERVVGLADVHIPQQEWGQTEER